MNYRELLLNEKIERGDQYESPTDQWLPTTRVGEIHGGGQKLRRPIDPLREEKERYGFVSAEPVSGPAIRAGRHIAVTLTSAERPTDRTLVELAGGRFGGRIERCEILADHSRRYVVLVYVD